MVSRRNFLAAATMAPAGILAASSDIPRYDLHCHLNPPMTLERALQISKDRNVHFGIVEHAGHKEYYYPNLISTGEQMARYIAMLEGKPVWKGIQAEGPDWMSCFSKQMVARLDYVLSDALTLTDRGKQERIWLPTFEIGDTEDFMERYTDFNVRVMKTEPLDIMANPTFLPERLAPQYDNLWTGDRLKKIVRAAAEYNVALEINSAYQVPRLPMLKMAKRAGCRFSFGSNIHGTGVGNIDYGLEMAKELGLMRKDFFQPAKPGRKPIEIRQFA